MIGAVENRASIRKVLELSNSERHLVFAIAALPVVAVLAAGAQRKEAGSDASSRHPTNHFQLQDSC
jgi:hypothetical protein